MPPKTRKIRKWRSEKSVRSTKRVLQERINAFFSNEVHQQRHTSSYQTWNDLSTTSVAQWDIRTVIDIANSVSEYNKGSSTII